MDIYNTILKNGEFLETAKKIENIKFITDGKWDWEHGLNHYKRVADYAKKILTQLNSDDRTIDLTMTAALLHDIGLIKGDKVDHAIESSKLFEKFLLNTNITKIEIETIKQAIADHSKGNNIESLIGLALVLADKLDVTCHRTISSSIQDQMNTEIQKIRRVDIKITNDEIILIYHTLANFDLNIFKNWKKAITIPKKIADYLKKDFTFIINDKKINYQNLL